MPKWRVARVPTPKPLMLHVARIVLGAVMAVAAVIALPHARAGDTACSLFQARLETSAFPALELHICAMVPWTAGAAIVRYDVAVRIAIMPVRPR